MCVCVCVWYPVSSVFPMVDLTCQDPDSAHSIQSWSPRVIRALLSPSGEYPSRKAKLRGNIVQCCIQTSPEKPIRTTGGHLHRSARLDAYLSGLPTRVRPSNRPVYGYAPQAPGAGGECEWDSHVFVPV